MFVNPVPGELSAGRLIDDLGLRGLRIGTAWVSEKHANFIQAGEGGRAADVRAVMEAVRRRVADERGFRLRSEVRLVGFARRARVGDATHESRWPRDDSGCPVRHPTASPADVPSAEVLDELLRAFSVDVNDRARLEQVDLASPEVDELLAAGPKPQPELESQPPPRD